MKFLKKNTRKSRAKNSIKGWRNHTNKIINGWKNLRIGIKYGLAFTMVMVLFLASTAISFKLLSNVHENTEVLESNSELAIQVTRLDTLFGRKESSILNYMSSKQAKYIQEFKNNSKDFEKLRGEIEGSLVNDTEKELLTRIDENNDAMTEIFEKQIIPALKEGKTGALIGARKDLATLTYSTSVVLENLNSMLNESRDYALKNVMDRITKTGNVLIISFILSTVIGAIGILIISRNISKNLRKIIVISNHVAEGDLTVEKMNYKGNDEIGKLSGAINDMLESLRSMIKDTLDASEEISIESGTMSNISSEVRLGSQQIAATMEQMAAGVQEQASSSMEVSQSLAEFNTRIQNVNEEGNKLNQSSHMILSMSNDGNKQMISSVTKMQSINETVQESVKKINGLDQKTQDISQLVQVIDNIANQTNLLALNAAIEAARAGEAGRGFAVVADEIRNLAVQVGHSVSEITDIVTGIQDETKSMSQSLDISYKEVKEGTDTIQMTGETFSKINDEVKEMAEKIQNISNNLVQISENSYSVNQAIEQISSISQENSAGIEETASSAQQQNSSTELMATNVQRVSNIANNLKEMMSRFKY